MEETYTLRTTHRTLAVAHTSAMENLVAAPGFLSPQAKEDKQILIGAHMARFNSNI